MVEQLLQVLITQLPVVAEGLLHPVHELLGLHAAAPATRAFLQAQTKYDGQTSLVFMVWETVHDHPYVDDAGFE